MGSDGAFLSPPKAVRGKRSVVNFPTVWKPAQPQEASEAAADLPPQRLNHRKSTTTKLILCPGMICAWAETALLRCALQVAPVTRYLLRFAPSWHSVANCESISDNSSHRRPTGCSDGMCRCLVMDHPSSGEWMALQCCIRPQQIHCRALGCICFRADLVLGAKGGPSARLSRDS